MTKIPRRHTFFRWLKRISLGAMGLLMLLTFVGACYEMLARHSAAKRFPPRGKLVDIGGRRIHLDCRGSGSPTVVFEAGFDSLGSLSWMSVHDAIAGHTRACAYDRAGIMWSDPKVTLQDGNGVAEDLHAALLAAGEAAPFVLVGHSLGGPYSMIFTDHYPDQVAGLVLVDPGHPDQLQQMRRYPVMKSMLDAAETVEKIFSTLAWTGLARLIMPDGAASGFPAAVTQQSSAYYTTSISAMHATRTTADRTLAQAGAHRTFGNRPLVVLSAKEFLDQEVLAAIGMSSQDGARFNADWRRFREDEASWSMRGRHEIVPNTRHYIQFDQPEVVIAAIREVVDAVRADRKIAASARRQS